ncbi:unnamed protein product [Didymodactylos carnosus]|uniref:Multifunctional fusion protein n=1 Tax=Didymodactylos carnosus TaxID=1234261 RepID=A0A8S2IN26_9BILA|nr:unnamed protein product [Didymodactylos carnosus]CAF3753207.1 unnamed protein product [Didymodactylos carnosus]
MGNKTPKSALTSTTDAAHIRSPSHQESWAQQRRNLEVNTIIWLDLNVSSTTDNLNAKVRLRQAINHFETFEDKQKCIDHIVSLESEKIYFIISGSLGESVVPLIHDKPQIEAIYVFCFDKAKHEKWAKGYEKVCAVSTNIDDICDQLTKDVAVSSNNLVSMTAVSPNTPGKEINKQEASFMYFQLLVNILTQFTHKDSTKQELIDLCRMDYAGNNKELNVIDQFDKMYSKEQAIEWYTKECFLYRMLNKALRTQDVDMLFKLGFFIKDLHEELHNLQNSSTTHLGRTITVYRGLGIPNKEFESLQKKVGGLLSMNSFLSTSAQEAVAVRFARNSLGRSDITSVLFEMMVDTEKCRQPFSNIKTVSTYSTEDEILFSMGTVFRIISIKKLKKEGVWNVKLKLNGDEDIELSVLTNHIKRELGESNNLNTLGMLLIRMGENSRAEQYFHMLLDDTSLDQSAHALAHNNLGRVYDNQADYEKALKSYEKSLEIYLISLPPNHPDIAATYNNIGQVYNHQGDYEKALKSYEKSLKIYLISLPPNHPDIATTYNNIGSVYDKQGDYEKALKSYEKSVEIKLISLPPNHPDTATTYNNIGSVYYKQGDYEKALKSYEKALSIVRRTLPLAHPTRRVIESAVTTVREKVSK